MPPTTNLWPPARPPSSVRSGMVLCVVFVSCVSCASVCVVFECPTFRPGGGVRQLCDDGASVQLGQVHEVRRQTNQGEVLGPAWRMSVHTHHTQYTAHTHTLQPPHTHTHTHPLSSGVSRAAWKSWFQSRAPEWPTVLTVRVMRMRVCVVVCVCVAVRSRFLTTEPLRCLPHATDHHSAPSLARCPRLEGPCGPAPA